MRHPQAPVITEIPVAEAKDGPYGITVGPDGALWAALEIGGAARLVAT